jgi:hypothetical protein
MFDSMFLPTCWLILLIAFAVAVRIGIRSNARRRGINPPAPTVETCRCGYPLEKLSVPRCPECGRVIGFDATPEELGLNDEHLNRAQAAKVRRREEKQ